MPSRGLIGSPEIPRSVVERLVKENTQEVDLDQIGKLLDVIVLGHRAEMEIIISDLEMELDKFERPMDVVRKQTKELPEPYSIIFEVVARLQEQSLALMDLLNKLDETIKSWPRALLSAKGKRLESRRPLQRSKSDSYAITQGTTRSTEKNGRGQRECITCDERAHKPSSLHGKIMAPRPRSVREAHETGEPSSARSQSRGIGSISQEAECTQASND